MRVPYFDFRLDDGHRRARAYQPVAAMGSEAMPSVNDTGPNTSLLLEEASMLMSSIDANVTRLWQIRSVEVTIWIFALSAGLGQFANGKMSIALLLLGLALPLFFVPIDRRLNHWYLFLRTRTNAISRQINDDSSRSKNFPLFDPSLQFTHVMKPALWRFDWNVLLFYGAQCLVSAGVVALWYFGVL
jgi:hypothetical protein